MKTTSVASGLLALVAVSIAALSSTGTSRAQLPAKSGATASATVAVVAASASASAAGKRSLPEIPDLPSISTIAIPTERSEMPPRDGWAEAKEIAPTRSRAPSCKVYLLREYAKVSCNMNMAGIRQFAGNAKDVRLYVPQKPLESGRANLFAEPYGADVTFPLRRGEGFVFQFFTIEMGYESVDSAPSTLVDVNWPTSEDHPTLVLQ